MPPDLRAAALSLPDDEKLELAQVLWDSTGADTLSRPTDEEVAELDRRRANLAANPGSARPWAEAYERLKARYGG